MYRIVPDDATIEQVASLPLAALTAYAELLALLELTPWAGHPQNAENPDGPVRWMPFGPGGHGQAVYLVFNDRREVHLLLVQWLG